MTRTTLLAALLAAIAGPAAANPLGGLYQFTAQVRAQAAVVRAQAEATFSCPRGDLIADDVYDELRDLCRDLDRLEYALDRPITSRHQLGRLERRVRRLDDQACEVQEAIHEAIADRRFAPQPIVQAIPGVPPHVARRLPPATLARLAAIHAPQANRGVSVQLGGGRFHLAIGGRPTTALRPAAFDQPIAAPNPAADALCHEAQRLRRMTQQLLAIVSY